MQQPDLLSTYAKDNARLRAEEKRLREQMNSLEKIIQSQHQKIQRMERELATLRNVNKNGGDTC